HGLRHAAARRKPGELRRRRLAMHQMHHDVAVEQRAALFGETGEEGRRQRLDAGDRRDAEQQAGEEDAETAKALPHLAPRETYGEREPVYAVSPFDKLRVRTVSSILMPSPSKHAPARPTRCGHP